MTLSIPVFTPPFPTLELCSYFVLAEITQPDGSSTIATGIAQTYPELTKAIADAVFGFLPSITQDELRLVEAVVDVFDNPDNWVINFVTGAPVMSVAGILVQDCQITVRALALMHYGTPLEAEPVPMPVPLTQDDDELITLTRAQYVLLSEGASVMRTKDEAKKNFNVPFIGHTDPASFAMMVNAILSADSGELMRLTMEGENEDLGVMYDAAIDNPDDIVEVQVVFDANGTEAEEIISLFANFTRREIETNAGLLWIKVRGRKIDVAEAIDWASEKVVTIRVFGHDAA